MLNNISFSLQERVIRAVRTFFSDHQFHEIIAPVLSETIPLEPNIYPFVTDWHVSTPPQRFFLSTSPERSLKLALAQGIGDCYAIGHCFRDLEGSGPLHSPEFLMLEWYRQNATYTNIMHDVRELVLFIHKELHPTSACTIPVNNQTIPLDQPWPTLSLVDLFRRHAHLSIEDILDDTVLYDQAQKKGYATENTTWYALFDQIFLNEVEPQLPKTPYFLIDFPTRISPLCTPCPDRPYVAQRFELFIGGIEIGNGNTEFTRSEPIRATFEKEAATRQQQHHPIPNTDEAFLAAIDRMHTSTYAGIGLGIERLALLLSPTCE